MPDDSDIDSDPDTDPNPDEKWKNPGLAGYFKKNGSYVVEGRRQITQPKTLSGRIYQEKETTSMDAWELYLKDHKDRFIDELLEFLRIPSISSLKAHRPDVDKAAQWIAARMKQAGIESVKIMPTGGHPVVYGDWLHAADKPTILIYGHFDTQPVDPLELWDTPPFDPVVRNERVYARGATDDKGNLFIPLTVVEAMLKTEDTLPVNLKFMFEGQEEIGSPQLPQFLSANKDLFSADLVLSADGGQWDEDQPLIVLGTRGLAAVFLDVQGPKHDLHSGTYGGAIANPIHALATIIDSMHDKDGRVAVKGFYDHVLPLYKGKA